MALRIPPGRAGRQWLAARIATAEHARDLLEQKRAVLIGAEREAASALWHARAAEAERWLERTAVLDGERPRRLAQAHSGPAAAMRITWGTTMGVAVPADAYVALPPPPDAALLPGGSALTSALAAHRRALDAALQAAVARAAHERLAAELLATVRRVRAIESRWLPLHEQALAALEQTLDEHDRAEGARIRWASRQGRQDSTER
jgi:V/A-type H+/Na+-transporting ATPase subunit D